MKRNKTVPNDMPNHNARNRLVKLLFTGIILVILAVTIIPRAYTIYELSLRKNELEKEKTRLLAARQERLKRLEELKSPQAMEKIAREQLGMVKKGERVIMQVTDDR